MPQYLSPGVYIEETDGGSRPIEGVGTAVAAFIGLTASGPVNVPTLVSNWTQFVDKFTDKAELQDIEARQRRGAIDEQEAERLKSRLHLDPFEPGAYLPHSVFGYFMNGGGNAYIVRVGADGSDGDRSPAPPVPLQGDLPSEGGAGKEPPYRVVALPSAPTGADLRVEVRHPAPPPDNPDGAPKDVFDLVVLRGDQVVEEITGLSTKRGKQGAASAVRERSRLIQLEERASGAAVDRPAAGVVTLSKAAVVPAQREIAPDDFVGDVSSRTGTGGLEAIEDITMVCAPDLSSAYDHQLIDAEQFKAVQQALITHCELMGDRMAILDPPPNLDAQQVKTWRAEEAGYDSKYAALYYPRIKVMDPSNGHPIMLPPSGHVAGLWARTDAERGVHKAPANDILRGAVDLERSLTTREHDLLNSPGINCIRAFPRRGIRVYGARTLTSDPAWRYLSVRRLFNYLEKSILMNTDWVVFEPNDRTLWAKIRRTIASFLVLEWRKGALFGSTPAEAFFVKCDDETNPAEAIDAGEVRCVIGVAPVKPAEFVIFELSQMQGGVSLVAE
ncbi:phage tail sheath family protein [Motilibacter deserti]|uniref:Phage tail sheath family protein n=1 Tax=Motilibacter deserti TaxID=2714956 RepID=A0ABX0GSF1_9ACTN|nr:phage tail sheath subtilisin-like domain-containing protein [Motilibacter deserti]NHC13811.1 phage tail sheath family protein [Motilibacter deserti]